MREHLLALSKLQDVDTAIAAVRKAVQSLPAKVQDVERALGALQSELAAHRAKVDDLARQKATVEENLASEKDKVRKWEARLAEQRSTREYTALAREIDIAKKSNQTQAEELTALVQSQVLAREQLKVREGDVARQREGLETELATLKGRIDAAEKDARAFDGRRSDAEKAVQPALLKRYDTIRKKRIPALVTLEAPGTCSGCRMNVPPQLYNALKSSLGYDVCPACQRLVCAPEALDSPKS